MAFPQRNFRLLLCEQAIFFAKYICFAYIFRSFSYMLVAIVICSICSRSVPRAYDVFIYQRTHKIRHWTIVAFNKPQIST